MDNLTAGIWPFLDQGKTGQDTVELSRVRIAPDPLCEGWQTSPESVAALAWNQWQACRGMGGSFAMESVADFVRNTQPAGPRIDSPLLKQGLPGKHVVGDSLQIRNLPLVESVGFPKLTECRSFFVEYNPERDFHGMTGYLAAKLMKELLSKMMA